MESQAEGQPSDGEQSADEDEDTPETPSSGTDTFQFTRIMASQFSSLDSTDLPSLSLKNYLLEPSSQPMTGTREMTLRMTLTRPELRAKEEDLYGWQTKTVEKDPLGLPELPPPVEDVTGAHGAFAIKSHKSIVTKLFGKVKKGVV
jgi:hypothetical protein